MQRIISLVPSQTELLYDLGLEEEVVAVTKFCVHPGKWFKTKTRIGGTKTIDLKKIASIKPDLVIANKEENVKEQIEELEKFTRVYVSDVANLADALNMILDIGMLVDCEPKARLIMEEIKTRFSEIEKPGQDKLNAAYFIWRNPYMVAGADTFINDMMSYCGFINVFGSKLRYPQTSINELEALNCKVLLLASEPFPFKQKHIDELQPLLPGIKILLVDGEMFSWYGSRLLHAPGYFKQLMKMF